MLEVFCISLRNNPPGHIDPTAFITLAVVGLIESIVFIVIGFFLAYLPSFLISSMVLRRKLPGPLVAVTLGSIIGLAFLPVCASVAFFPFMDPDDPTYLARCAEFAAPMILSGAVGGYAFWRPCLADIRESGG
jgi:hypothetical protein